MSNRFITDLKNDREKNIKLASNIIELFLKNYSEEIIANLCDTDVELVKYVVAYKKFIIETFGESKYQAIIDNKKNRKIMEKEQAKYDQVYDMLNVYLKSLYTIDDLAQRFFVTKIYIDKIFNDEEYITNNFGAVTYKTLKLHSDKIKHLNLKKSLTSIVVRPAEYREIIKPSVIIVTPYQYALIERTYLFLNCNGNLDYAEMPENCTKKIIINSAFDKDIDNLLNEKALKKLNKLKKIHNALYGDDFKTKRELTKNAVIKIYQENNDIEKASVELDIPVELLEKIIKSPLAVSITSDHGINIQIGNEEKPKVKVVEKYLY